jgi:hypothetical protein
MMVEVKHLQSKERKKKVLGTFHKTSLLPKCTLGLLGHPQEYNDWRSREVSLYKNFSPATPEVWETNKIPQTEEPENIFITSNKLVL